MSLRWVTNPWCRDYIIQARHLSWCRLVTSPRRLWSWGNFPCMALDFWCLLATPNPWLRHLLPHGHHLIHCSTTYEQWPLQKTYRARVTSVNWGQSQTAPSKELHQASGTLSVTMVNSSRRKVNYENIFILLTSSVDLQEDTISIYLMHAVSDKIDAVSFWPNILQLGLRELLSLGNSRDSKISFVSSNQFCALHEFMPPFCSFFCGVPSHGCAGLAIQECRSELGGCR